MVIRTNVPATGRVVPAVVQAMKLLRAMASASGGVTVTSAARATGISQSTCFNLLRTMVQERVLNFDADTKTYTLGLGLVEIANSVQSNTPVEIIRPELMRLATSHDALVTLWEIVGKGRMVLLDGVAAPRAVRIEIRAGQRLPTLSGAVGRCVAAHLDLSPSQLRKAFDALSWEKPPSYESFLADMQQSKVDGYAIDRGYWLRGIIAVGSVVLDAKGKPRMGLGALTLTGQLSDAELRRVGQELVAVRSLIEKAVFSSRALFSTSSSA